jgi:hypothetical protein
MARVLDPGESYAGRAPGVVPVNLTIDREAYELLQQHAPGKKTYGRFLSRLIYEHTARQAVWQQVREQLRTLVGEEVSPVG